MEEKQNSDATITISVYGKGTVFPMKLKLQGSNLNKPVKKKGFKKYIMNLIETDHQVNITSDHFVSNNDSFKSHLNAKSFNMFLTR